MATLNGWQRIWVVFTVFWTVVVLSISYGNWPSPSGSLRELEAGVLDTTKTEEEFRRAFNAVLAEEIRQGRDPRQSDDPFAPFYVQPCDVDDRFTQDRRWVFRGDCGSLGVVDVGTKVAPEELRLHRERWVKTISQTKLDTERQALRDGRVEHVQVTLMVWAIPPVVLYAFGWSAGWIRRGFRG
ncbi:hypothetical protein JYU09_00500 [bacterium AH-315-O15]|nr:hypothetical protein [bacterium AH-315-O15]